MLVLIYAVLFILIFAVGAVIGSFLNVLIYRIPKGLNPAKGFSFCPTCRHRLFAKDLVPVFSYLLLGRKCRYCRTAISPRYMVNELIGGGLAAASWYLAGSPIQAVLYFALLCVLLTIAWIDADTMEIPDVLNIAVAVLGVLSIWLGPAMPLREHLIGAAVVSVPLFLISLVIGGAFGMGDVLLLAAAGLFLGWKCVLVAAFIGILIGGVYGVYLLASKRKGRQEHFAFGPALCVGIGISLFAGNQIIAWYMGWM